MLETVKHSLGNVHPYFDEERARVVRRWVLLLPGSGCQWWKDSNGGCTMCALPLAARKYSLGFLLPPHVFQLLYATGCNMVNTMNPETIAIFNGGSFICDNEIPLKAQRWLFEQISKHPTIEKVMIESLPQFITREKLADLVPRLGGKTLEIGIGLEVYSDRVRSKNVRKNFSRIEFERAVKLLKSFGVKFWTYVFLKPLGLSEGDAIEEAVDAVKYASFLGSSEIALSCAFIQERTKMADAYHSGEFTPPRLWSVIEVLNRCKDSLPRVHIGGFTDDPEPIAIPKNCDKCSGHIYDLIENYRRTHDLDMLLKSLPDCDCRANWLETIN